MDSSIRQVPAESMKINIVDTSMNNILYLFLCDVPYHKRVGLDVRMVVPSSVGA